MKKLNLEDILKSTSDLTKEKKVWYISIIWRPNAWKSTFINSISKRKSAKIGDSSNYKKKSSGYL